MTMLTLPVRLSLASLLAVATVACGANEPAPASSVAATEATSAGADSETVDALPLTRGYYVSTDVTCGNASNATLALVRADGISACGFDRIERIGASRYRVDEICSDHQGPAPIEFELTQDYEVLAADRYRVIFENGQSSEFRFCEQKSLPEPWRDNDISDVTG